MVHNYDFKDADRRRLRRWVQKCRNSGEELFLFGDFNFAGAGEVTTTISTKHGAKHEEQKRESKMWAGILEGLTELCQDMPTRTAVREHGGESLLTATKIDRFYTTMPAWKLALVNAAAKLGACPVSSWQSIKSDHVPATMAMTTPNSVLKNYAIFGYPHAIFFVATVPEVTFGLSHRPIPWVKF